MEVISELQNIDLTSWIIVGFMIMAIIVTFYEVICKVCAIFNKPIGAMKQRKADHALLVETVQDLKQLHESTKKILSSQLSTIRLSRKNFRCLPILSIVLLPILKIWSEKITKPKLRN